MDADDGGVRTVGEPVCGPAVLLPSTSNTLVGVVAAEFAFMNTSSTSSEQFGEKSNSKEELSVAQVAIVLAAVAVVVEVEQEAPCEPELDRRLVLAATPAAAIA